MKLRYTVPASADLESILSYISSRSPQGAKQVAERLRETERLILAFPMAGARTRLPWLRRMSASPYPYLIFYEIDGSSIVIHAVRHAARRSFPT